MGDETEQTEPVQKTEDSNGTDSIESVEKDTEIIEKKSFISVEDGTGMTDSNSYVSVVSADDYFSARNVSEWESLAESSKESALIRATDYIDNIFQWHGKKLVPNQSLRFPRQNLVDYEGNKISGIPNCLKQAVCDAALVISQGTELFQIKEANGDVVSEKIGELSFTYSKTSRESVTGISLYDSINTKLRGLFKDTSKNRIVVGKVERV